MQTKLTLLQQTDIDSYKQNGYLIINNFYSHAICDLLMQRALQLIEDIPNKNLQNTFSTTAPLHQQEKYFLESGDKISLFFEADAFDQQGKLRTATNLCINKIGHALHDLDPIFSSLSRSHKLASLAADLSIQDPLLVQSMYIFKQPHIGGEVICHQDSTFLYVEPKPITGFWFALQDATIENGCLWAIPGGHQTTLKSRMIRNEFTTKMVVYDDSTFPDTHMQALEVAKGSLIVLHGLLPHMSKRNESAHSRHAYALHVMSGKDQYAQDNWLQRSEALPFTGFF